MNEKDLLFVGETVEDENEVVDGSESLSSEFGGVKEKTKENPDVEMNNENINK